MIQIDVATTDRLHWLIVDTNVWDVWDLDQLIGEMGWDDKDFLIQFDGREPLIVKGKLIKIKATIDPRNSKGQLFILL